MYSKFDIVLDKVDDICERFELDGLHQHPTYKQFKRLFTELKAAAPAEDVRLVSYAEDMSTCTLTKGDDGQGYFYDRIDAEDVRAVVEEPVAWLVEAADENGTVRLSTVAKIQWTAGNRDMDEWAAGRTVTNTPLFRHPQRPINVEAIREIRDRFVQAADLARKAAANCKELNERGAEKTYLKSAAAHDARVAALDVVLGK